MTIRSKLLLAFIPILFSLIVVVLIGSTSLRSLQGTLAGLYQNQLLPSKQIGYTHLHLVKLEDSLNDLVSARSPDEMKIAEGQVRAEIGQVQTHLDKIGRKSLSASEQALLLQFADHWSTMIPEVDQVDSYMKRGDNLGAQKALDTAKIQFSILDSLLTGLSEANELQGSKAFDQSEQLRRGLIILIGSIVLAALTVSLYIIYLIRETTERRHLDQSIRMYRVLSECNQALSQCSNDQTLLAQICTIIQNIGQYPQVWVGYIEYDEARTIKPAFVLGFDMDVFDQMINSWGNNNSGGGLTGQAARSGKPVIMHDISKIAPPYWRKGVDQYKLGSGIALPLKNGDHVFGTLSIYSQDPKGFNPPEVDLLTRLADNLALGLIMLESRENQHKMEQALRESEYKLRAVYDHHYQFTGLLDATGQTISVNQAALNLVRTDLQAIQGNPFWECPWWTHSPELQEKLKQGIQQVLTGASVRFDATHRDWQGNLHDIDFSMTPILDDNGQVTMIVPEGNDITDRKRTEMALRESERKLRSVIEEAPFGMQFYSLLPGGRLVLDQVNPAASRILKIDHCERLGKTIEEAFPGLVGTEIPDIYRRLASEGGIWRTTPFEYDSGGIQGAFEVTAFQILPNRMVATFVDVTERKLAETGLETQRRTLQAVLANVPVGVLMVSASDGKPILNNNYAEILLGRAILPDPTIHAMHEFLQVFRVGTDELYPINETPIVAGLEGRSIRIDDMEIRKADGTRVQLEIIGAPVRDSHGQIMASVVVFSDITERKRDERLIQSQINQLTLLQEVDRAIITNSGLKATAQAVIKPIAHYFGADAIEILVLDESRQKLLHTAQHGFQRPEHLKPFLMIGEGIAGQAALENQIVEIENDISALACPDDQTFYQREGFVSCFALPLTTSARENTGQGVLQFFYRKPIVADKDWLDYLRAVGDQVAIAVEKALLFERLQHTLESLVKAYETTMEGWVYALDLRDQETENHTLRVVDLTLQIAREMGVPEDQLLAIRRGALLHDIGKLGIPDAILRKPAVLDEDEMKVMRMHPALAFEMLSSIEYLHGSLDIPFCHHEKWDGTGYPRGLKGDNIPLSARIFAVVDVWDALTSDRVYRKALPKEEALQIILRQAGKQFDPKVVGHFLNFIQNMSIISK